MGEFGLNFFVRQDIEKISRIIFCTTIAEREAS